MNKEVMKTGKANPSLGVKYSNIIFQTADSIDFYESPNEARLILSDILRAEGKYDSALLVLNQFLKKKNPRYYQKEHIPFLVNRGITYYGTSSYDSALADYQLALKLALPTEVDSVIAGIYYNRASVFSVRGNFYNAIQDYSKVAQFYERNDMNEPLAQVYSHIGREQYNLRKFETSIEYDQKAAEINERLDALPALCQNYLNIGVSYKELGSVDAAIRYFKKSLGLAKRVNNSKLIAQSEIKLGDLYKSKKEYEEAQEYFRLSLEVCKKSGIQDGTAVSLTNLGETYQLTGNLDLSEKYLREALSLVRELKLPDIEYQLYRNLAALYKTLGRYKEALENNIAYHAINDSILSQKKKEYIIEMEKKYETQQKELTIGRLGKKASRLKIIISSLIILSLILTLFIQRYRAKHKLAARDHLIDHNKAAYMKKLVSARNEELNNLAIQLVQLQNRWEDTFKNVSSIVEKYPESQVACKAKILNALKIDIKHSQVKNEFETTLSKVNQDYYNSLLEINPDFSPTELKVCALLRMNLTTKEIAQISNRSIRTIDYTRNSIRKKLNLSPQDNLPIFLIAIS